MNKLFNKQLKTKFRPYLKIFVTKNLSFIRFAQIVFNPKDFASINFYLWFMRTFNY